MAQEKILVVEDEVATRTMVAGYFRGEGYTVIEAGTQAECLDAFARDKPDLILMDINLPDGNGLSLARELRGKCDAGVIFVTMRDNDIDRVLGLEMCGDDYVTKPINLRELLARARSVLRRRASVPADRGLSDVRRFDGWTIDLARRDLFDSENKSVRLTRGEFDLLATLVRSGGRPVSRDYLLDVVSNREDEVSDRTVDMLVSRLRRKIEKVPQTPQIILTVHGVGYRFGVPVAVA